MLEARAENNLANMNQSSPLTTPSSSPISQVAVQHPLDVMNLAELFKKIIVSIKVTSDSTPTIITNIQISDTKKISSIVVSVTAMCR